MRATIVPFLVAGGILGGGVLFATADEPAGVKEQKETALANWKQLFGDEQPVVDETAHLLLVGPSAVSAKQLRDLGAALEARYQLACKALKIEPTEELWKSKLAVYLIPDRRQFSAFMRTVAKRRPSADDSGVFSVAGSHPYVAACPPGTKYDPPMEAQAGEQLVSALIAKQGKDGVPDWLVAGFARATAWHAAPGAYYQERNHLKRLIRGHTVQDIWTSGKLSAEEAPLLRASLADFLAYGPGAASFPKLVEAFKPAETGPPKTPADALKAIRYDPERLNAAWLSWVAKGR